MSDISALWHSCSLLSVKERGKKKNAPRGLTLQMIREGGDEAARELPGFLSFSLASLSKT